MSKPLRVLFVCTANICRSPFLELYARRHLASPAVEFASAGTHGFVDHPISEEMGVEIATHWDLDANGFRSRRLTGEIVDESDLVLTAERSHRQFILDDHAHAFRKVLTLGQAVRAAQSMAAEPGVPGTDSGDALAELARHRGMADPSDDIADPYRRGVEAQSAAARQMSAMLEALRPLLQLHQNTGGMPTHG